MSRFGQPMEIDRSNFGKQQLNDIRKVVHPVGPWRFLTPIDIIQAGDLVRIVSEGMDDANAAYNANWSPVDHALGSALLGKLAGDLSSGWELIRALEHGYTVPMFNIPPPDGAEEDDDE